MKKSDVLTVAFALAFTLPAVAGAEPSGPFETADAMVDLISPIFRAVAVVFLLLAPIIWAVRRRHSNDQADVATAEPTAASGEDDAARVEVIPALGSKTSPFATVSVITGIAGWTILPVLGALAAVVTGHIARRQIGTEPTRYRGRGRVAAGLALGYTQLAALALVTTLLLVFAPRPPAAAPPAESKPSAPAVSHQSTGAAPAPTSRLALPEAGKWSGNFGFTLAGNTLSDPVLMLSTRDGEMVNVYFYYLNEEIEVKDGSIFYRKKRDGGEVTLQGAFISASEAAGTWKLSKGTKVAGGTATITEDSQGEWRATRDGSQGSAVPSDTTTPAARAMVTAPVTATPSASAVHTAQATGAPTATAPLTFTGGRPSDAARVPAAQLNRFFAPCHDPVGIATASSDIWVACGEHKRIHRLTRNGAPLDSFAVDLEGELRGLAWDGEALRILTRDWTAGPYILRVDAKGKLLSRVPVPVESRQLAWEPASGTLWTIPSEGADGLLVQLAPDGALRDIIDIPLFGNTEALAWDSEGLLLLNPFGRWHQFSASGEYLASDAFSVDLFAKSPSMAVDEQGTLWLTLGSTGEVYEYGFERRPVDGEMPPELRAVREDADGVKGQMPLPKPARRVVSGERNALVRVENALGKPLTVALDSAGGEFHGGALVEPGGSWSAALPQARALTLYLTANDAQPRAYFGRILSVPGYEQVWRVEP